MHGKKTRKKEKPRNESKHGTKISSGSPRELDKNTFENADHGNAADTMLYTESYGIGISTALGTAFFCIYLKTLYPSIPGGDSGELIPAAYELGVAHPPGYPLFTLLSWCIITLFPFGSVAWRVNVLNALLSGVSVSLLALIILRLTRSLSAALLAVGVWGFCKLTWTWAVTAEVFGLNNAFITLLLYIALKFSEANNEDKEKISLVGSFVCGLSLCNQHTIVIYVLVLAVWVMAELYFIQRLTIRCLTRQTLAFLAGMSPYLYLPVSSYYNKARWTWGDQRSLKGFIKHIVREEYGTFDLGKDQEGLGFLSGISSYSSHLLEDLTPLVFTLFCIGTILLIIEFRSEKNVVAIYWTMMVVYVSFFSWRANLNTHNLLFLGVVERFWMQGDIIIVIVSSFAYSKISRWIYKWMGGLRKYHVDLVLAVVVTVYQMQRNYTECDQSENTVIADFGRQILHTLPNDAIILTKGDLSSNSFRYLQLCENVRPDIQIFDQEVMTYDWSVAMLGGASPGITFPGDLWYLDNRVMEDGRKSFDFKTFLDANYDRRPIYGCIGVQEHEPSWKPFYELWPFGVCHRFIKIGDHVDIKEYSETVMNWTINWTYPHNKYDGKSWEKVANDEMWHAKISLGFFFYEKSQNQQEEDREMYLIYAYKLYKDALEKHTDFPNYWHKNFALVCHHMLHSKHQVKYTDLLQETIHHFQLFADLEPLDKDVKAIRSVISQLTEHASHMSS